MKLIFLSISCHSTQNPTRLVINTPDQLKQFKNRSIGNNSNIVYVGPAVDSNVLHQARYFFNNTRNDVIRFKDRSNNYMHIYPKNQSVQATLTNGSRLAYYLPKHYKSYNLTFNSSELNNNVNLREIFEFRNATNLWLGNGFEVRHGYERIIDGIRNMSKLKELTINIQAKNLTIQLAPFMELPPMIRTVRFTFPLDQYPWTKEIGYGGQVELARNQCIPRGWDISSDADGSVQFDKTGRDVTRWCWMEGEKSVERGLFD